MVKIGINGFGRIGRLVMREMLRRKEFDVRGINDLTDAATLGHLFKYDSVHGKYDGTVETGDDFITVDGKKIKVFSEKNPEALPWKDLGVDVVIEATGVFRSKEKVMPHISSGGARKVLITAPAKGEVDYTIVPGVNDDGLKEDHVVVSTASCTTNSIAPIIKILNDKLGIVTGFLTTIHAYTNDQRILDLPHSDLRRARAAAVNTIPTTTGAAKAVGKVIPELKGKLDGVAMRVPVPDGSMTDLTLVVKQETTVEEVHSIIEEAANSSLKGIIEFSREPLVSSDIIGTTESGILDSLLTYVSGTFVRIFSWYDNEYGYSCRVVDVAKRMAEM